MRYIINLPQLATMTNKKKEKKRKRKRAQMASNTQQLLEVVERLELTGADAINFIREQQELARVENGLVYRNGTDKSGLLYKQIVVPEKLKNDIMKLGHESKMSGHLGNKKSLERIRNHFF